MRRKTEAKRDEILGAAAALFAEHGFHATTLALVAARLKSSKATIYNYFQSKEELFRAVLVDAASPVMASLMKYFEGARPFPPRLVDFARAYMRIHTSPYAMAVVRLIITEVGRSDWGRELLAEPAVNIWASVVRILEGAQRDGDLVSGDPVAQARHLRALLDGGLPHLLLIGERDRCTVAEADASATAAVEVFLAAFGAR